MRADLFLRPRHLAQVGSATERHPGLRGVRCHGAKPVVTDWLDPARRRVPRPGGGHRALAKQDCTMRVSGIMMESGEDWQLSGVKPRVDAILDSFLPRAPFGDRTGR